MVTQLVVISLELKPKSVCLHHPSQSVAHGLEGLEACVKFIALVRF